VSSLSHVINKVLLCRCSFKGPVVSSLSHVTQASLVIIYEQQKKTTIYTGKLYKKNFD
jgi:hypothetical protein